MSFVFFRPAIGCRMTNFLLAVESVGRGCSVCAVAADGTERFFVAADSAARDLVPLIADCRAVLGTPGSLAVAVGPGSFTGLRVGVTAVRTLAAVADLPIHPVPSLTALALAQGEGLWCCLQALKRDTTFLAVVRVEAAGPMVLRAPEALADVSPLVVDPSWVDAVAIGPALMTKPGLLPMLSRGSLAPLDARGVAQAARYHAAVGWRDCLPAYLHQSAPEIQRAAGAG